MINLSDEQIANLIDGTADANLAAQVAADEHLQAQLDAARQTEARLTTVLYRWDCPSPEQIGDLFLKSLSAAQQTALENHLAICQRCNDELAMLTQFMEADNAPPRMALDVPSELPFVPANWQEVRLQPLQATPSSAWRGDSDGTSHVFETEGITLFLEEKVTDKVQSLNGQVVINDPAHQHTWRGALAELRQNGDVRTATLDDFGDFSFDNLTLANSVTLRITNESGKSLIWSRDNN